MFWYLVLQRNASTFLSPRGGIYAYLKLARISPLEHTWSGTSILHDIRLIQIQQN